MKYFITILLVAFFQTMAIGQNNHDFEIEVIFIDDTAQFKSINDFEKRYSHFLRMSSFMLEKPAMGNLEAVFGLEIKRRE